MVSVCRVSVKIKRYFQNFLLKNAAARPGIRSVIPGLGKAEDEDSEDVILDYKFHIPIC